MPQPIFEASAEAARYIRAAAPISPKVAVILGSGLGAFAHHVENSVAIPYTEIPHFPATTVVGHGGRLVLGGIRGIPIAVMQGRVHYYEGYTPAQVTFPMRVLKQLGIETVIVTNAAGGIRQGMFQGELVLISDHINFTGTNPLIGPNEPRFGERFFDMTEAYSKRLRALAQQAAANPSSTTPPFTLNEGVYLAVTGPCFETPAEIRAFRALGADLVGMSTVHEVIAARHMGIEVLGISCVTNLAAGMGNPLNHEEVIETGIHVQQRLAELLTATIGILRH